MTVARPPYFGAAYYPEDWPLEQIDADIDLMKQAGMNCMRIGEFAWSRMEPEEGRYDFDWLHTAIDKLGKAGIATILGTPTCTPPIWLYQRYPECIAVRDDGVRLEHGARRHACPNSPTYRDHCRRIATAMGQEFGRNANVIGWQIDNELYVVKGVEDQRGCFCDECVDKFRKHLAERFGTIDGLNASWGTDLWSQTYQSFEQVPPPRSGTWHHPSLLTAWTLFQADSYVEFSDHQADVLHRLVNQPVGTDMMPTLGLDYEKMHRKLDVVQYNHYNKPENLWQCGFWMDMVRSLKDTPWWNTETSTCWNGSTAANGYREPGFCRVNSWLPYALGGEANLYWLWRAHRSGQELMHGSVVSAQGRPLHIFSEVQEIARGLTAAGEFLNTTQPARTGLALHVSTVAWWTFAHQGMVEGLNYIEAMMDRVYKPILQAQLRPEVIHPAQSLDPYRLICSPLLPVLNEEGLRDRVRAWIEAGGTWIVGPLSDIRDEHATKFRRAPYGVLEDWAGVYCKYEIPGDPRDFGLAWADGRTSNGSLWYDGLEPGDCAVLATYTEGPLEGLAAAVSKKLGQGRIVVLGTMPVADDWQKLLLDLGQSTEITPVAEATSNLLVVPRVDKAQANTSGAPARGLIVVELENRPATLHLAFPATDLLTGQKHSGTIEVAPYGVMVLTH